MTWIINGEWKTLNKIGTGAFGKVYRAVNLNNSKRFAAVKMEKIRPGFTPLLQIENEFYKKVTDTAGIPLMFFYGNTSCGKYKVLAMTLLGRTLERLTSRRTFSIKTVLMIGIQGLKRLEAIHSNGYLHRDIKPDNILKGRTDPERIYISDFGLAKRFKTPLNWHISFNTGYGLIGTRHYSSINALKGYMMSRRDDLESFGYTLVELLTGTLPWAGSGADTLCVKESTSISELCKDCPLSFEDYFEYVRQLRFEEKPDYEYLIQLFQGSLLRRAYEDDRKFDWMLKYRYPRCPKKNR